MKYIKLENNQPIHYTIEQLFIDHPDAVIYKNTQMPNEQLLSNYNVYPLITEAWPSVKEDETVEESTPEFRDGEWHQTWIVRKLTDDEIQEIIKNNSVDNNTNKFISSAELQDHRYKICKTCDSFTVLKTCSECGCIMSLKVKIANVSCPLKKW
jgi:hypothetical protein